MSQKTNPLSLRLQKTNRNFDSPNYWDYFLIENSTYQTEINDYTKKLFLENKYFNAFFSTKGVYQKINVFIILQDSSPLIKEKLLKFNLKLSQHSRENVIKRKAEKNNLLALFLKQKNTFLNNKQANNLTCLRNLIKQKNKIYNNTSSLLFRSALRKKEIKNFINLHLSDGSLIRSTNSLSLRETIGTQNRNLTPTSQIKKNKNVFLSLQESDNKKSFFLDLVCNSIFQTSVYMETIRFRKYNQSVISLLDTFVFLLEKRVSFTKIKSVLFKDLENRDFVNRFQEKESNYSSNTTLKSHQHKNGFENYKYFNNLLLKGIRISCSGRLGGRSKKAQKAKMQSYQYGQISLNAFCSKVSFARKSAYTTFGKIGVKIWICF